MDKDRLKGAAKQAKGKVKEAAGNVLGDAKLTGKIAQATASWDHFRTLDAGTLTLEKAGDLTLSIRPVSKPGVAVMNLSRVRLVPAEKYDALVAHVTASLRPGRGYGVTMKCR